MLAPETEIPRYTCHNVLKDSETARRINALKLLSENQERGPHEI